MKLLTFTFLAAIIGVIILADIGSVPRALRALHNFSGGDKVGHFLLMGFLALLMNKAFPEHRLKLGGRTCYWGTIAVTLMVTIEEFSQLAIPARTFSLMDLGADYLGIWILGNNSTCITPFRLLIKAWSSFLPKLRIQRG